MTRPSKIRQVDTQRLLFQTFLTIDDILYENLQYWLALHAQCSSHKNPLHYNQWIYVIAAFVSRDIVCKIYFVNGTWYWKHCIINLIYVTRLGHVGTNYTTSLNVWYLSITSQYLLSVTCVTMSDKMWTNSKNVIAKLWLKGKLKVVINTCIIYCGAFFNIAQPYSLIAPGHWVITHFTDQGRDH